LIDASVSDSVTHVVIQTSNLSKAHVTRVSSGPATLAISLGPQQ